jgi:cytosine/adenosine deaminase-related metal-dependent hydrolase
LKILKDAYVLTFNKNNDFGRYSLLLNGNKITDMADSSPKGAAKLAKWIEMYSTTAEIVDCSAKLLMPPLVNTCLKSEGSLLHYLLKRRHYEKAEEDLCTDLIFNYLYQELTGDTIKRDLQNIYDYSFNRSLKSGVASLNEFSLRKDTNHLTPVTNAMKKTGQSISVCYPIKQDVNTIRDYKYLNPSFYVTQENLLTVYDISGITELKNHNLRNLFLEVAVNKEITEQFRQTFRKSVIALFDEYGLIDSNTSLINPLYLDYSDMKIITERKANIIICPRDLNYFTSRYFPIDDYIGHGIKYTIATGWLGEDLLKEVRLFRNKYKELNLSSTELLSSVTRSAHDLYFNYDHETDTGYSIDINRQANIAFIDLSDLRFQFFPEEFTHDSVCDFIIDNLTSYNVTGVMINGEFKYRDGVLQNCDESFLVANINETRENLYNTGKYEELKKKRMARENVEKLDMTGRSDNEIKMFSDITADTEEEDEREEFRIKTRIPAFKQRKVPGQRSLFEESDHISIIQSDDFQQTPALNLLLTDSESSKPVEDDLVQVKAVDESIIKRLPTEKRIEKTPQAANPDSKSKIELPKNVKLKFGDD